jgi:hypothetical protein
MAEIGNIKKQTDSVDKQEKQLKIIREQLKAKCDHSKNGEPDIVPSNDRESTRRLAYVCRRCKKYIDLTKIPEDELSKACTTIDNACDVIKITLNKENEADAKVLKKVAKVQFRVRNEIAQLYGAALKRNRNGKKRNNDNHNDADRTWAKPQVDR